MKKNVMKLKKWTLCAAFFVALCSIVTISCDKKDMENPVVPFKSLSTPIPSFADVDELAEVLDSVSSFTTLDALVSFETQKGYKSLGRLCDVFFESYYQNDTLTEIEAKTLIEQYLDYLDIYQTGETDPVYLPRFYTNPFRYVVNEEGICIVGTYVLRLFQNGIVTTEAANLNSLRTLSEDDLSSLDTSMYNYNEVETTVSGSHGTCDFDGNAQDYKTGSGGKTRNYLSLNTFKLRIVDTRICHSSVMSYNVHHCFLGWFPEKYTMNVQGTLTTHERIDLSLPEWTKRTITINENKRAFYIRKAICFRFAHDVTNNGFFHYYYYYVSSNIPSTTPAVINNTIVL